jgi:glycosyltransferase involved in cell wall biosynthesis
MKILYILTNLNRSAPNTVIMNIIKNIHNSNVFILSLNKSQDYNYKKLLEQNDIKYIEYQSFKKAFLNINKVLTQFKDIDILHLNGYHPNIYAYFLKKFNSSYKLISTCHSVEDQEAQSHNFKGLSYFKTVVRLYLQKKFYPSHSCAIAVSNQVKEYLNGIGCTNARTIYNGVEYDKFPKLLSKKSNKEFLNLCQVGHVTNLKNQLYSVKLVEYLKEKDLNVKLHIFGSYTIENDYAKKINDYIEKKQLCENILFYGSLQFEELFKQLVSMDIYLMPSLSEGFPLAMVEAMYFELPAIVSSNGGMKEVIKDCENGLVVDINDEKEFGRIYEYIKSNEYLENGKRARV